MAFAVCYWEDDRVLTVLICRARSEADARARADALMPDGVFLSIQRKRGRS